VEIRRPGLVIADYGCAQGQVTNVLIRRAVEQIRAGYPEIPLSVLHNDLLTNDWAISARAIPISRSPVGRLPLHCHAGLSLGSADRTTVEAGLWQCSCPDLSQRSSCTA
jgi:hypothetical protein